MNAVAGLLRGRSIILKITRARNSIKFSKIHSSRGLAARSCGLARTRTRPHEWRLVLQKVTSEANPKVRNHGEGPYQGLLLVESGYYRFHI